MRTNKFCLLNKTTTKDKKKNADKLPPIKEIEPGDFEIYWEEVASRGEQEQIDYENMED